MFLPPESRKSNTGLVNDMGKISFVYPKRTEPVSITGTGCALSCAHCNGHYLEHMKDVFHSREDGENKDIGSYLVSGGCNAKGAVPLRDNITLLSELSNRHRVVAHTGLIEREDAAAIAQYVDSASFNLIGDDATIREVYGLHRTVQDFMDSYHGLREHVRTFPHITIGLHGGKIRGEYRAVDILSEARCDALVLNVFIPTEGTKYANATPPTVDEAADVITYANKQLNGAKIYIGCMRPGGSFRREFDSLCVKEGVDRIVMPARNARALAQEMGLDIIYREECCVL